MVKLLLENAANVNSVNDDLQTPLHLAAERGFTEPTQGEIIKLLIEHGANAGLRDKNHKTALDLAVKNGD